MDLRVTTIRLEDSYHSSDIEWLETTRSLLMEHADTAEPPLLLIDMANTSFIGSLFVNLLFTTRRRFASRGGQMALCSLNPYCEEVLRVVQFHTICPIYRTVEEAVVQMTAAEHADPDCAS